MSSYVEEPSGLDMFSSKWKDHLKTDRIAVTLPMLLLRVSKGSAMRELG